LSGNGNVVTLVAKATAPKPNRPRDKIKIKQYLYCAYNVLGYRGAWRRTY